MMMNDDYDGGGENKGQNWTPKMRRAHKQRMEKLHKFVFKSFGSNFIKLIPPI